MSEFTLADLEQHCPSKTVAKVDWLPDGQQFFVHKLPIESLIGFIGSANAARDQVETFEFAVELVAKTVGIESGPGFFDSGEGRAWLRANAMKAMDLMRQSQEFNELVAAGEQRKNG